jgi:hypothetical protein
MIIEGDFEFGIAAITGTTPTVSPYVYDAQAAVMIFAAGRRKPKLWFRATIAADASPSIKVDMLGAGNAALTTEPIVLGSSGVIAFDVDGTALVSGDTVEREFEIGYQVEAKRYYGLMVTLGGTNPLTSTAYDAYVVWDAQSNMVGARAAVPA